MTSVPGGTALHIMARALSLLLALLVACAATGVVAGTIEDLESDLRAFIEAAVFDQNGSPGPIQKRTGSIQVHFDGNPQNAHRQYVLDQVNLVMKGLRPAPAADAQRAGLIVRLQYSGEAMTTRQNFPCFYRTLRTSSSNEILRGEIVFNLALQSMNYERCVQHELMHALGFRGHPHHHRSVLSYLQNIERMTELDERLIDTLYDPTVQRGMDVVGALVAARRVLAVKHGLVPPVGDGAAQLARGIFEEFIGKLAKLAQGGNADAEAMLYYAHLKGGYLARDSARAMATLYPVSQAARPTLAAAPFKIATPGTRFESSSGGYISIDRVEDTTVFTRNDAGEPGEWIAGLFPKFPGSTVERDSAAAIWPLQVGRTATFTQLIERHRLRFRFEVIGTDSIPFGERSIPAFVIEASEGLDSGGTGDLTKVEFSRLIWFAPDLGWVVRVRAKPDDPTRLAGGGWGVRYVTQPSTGPQTPR